ncbi:MAG: hypothetical protein AAGD38_12055 [Acidobacteriota bacterium]
MFRRIANLFRGFMSLFVRGLERQNPEALIAAEKDNLRKQIAQFNQGLTSHAALAERLMSQVRRLEGQERELAAKTKAHLQAGNKDAAGQFALRLQEVRRQLGENREQAKAADATYKDLVRSREVAVEQARRKIQQLEHSLSDMKMQRAVAELSEMASGMIHEIGGSGDTLDRLHEMVEEERSKAAGRARVARDSIDTSGIDIAEAEQKALADQALAEFAAAEGIDVTGDSTSTESPPAVPDKTMGPQAQ